MKILGFFIMLIIPLMGVDQMPVVNIQTSMTSANHASFGRLTPYETESLGNVFVNPASLGGLSFNQLVISTFQLSSEIDYRHISFVFPYKNWAYSVSYGSNVTGGFIETAPLETTNGFVIRNIGEFSSGFNVLHLGMGRKIEASFFFVDAIQFGFGVNALTQVIGASRRSPAVGFDMGIITTSLFDGPLLNRLDVGLSAINAVSTKLPAWQLNDDGVSSEQPVERQLYAGSRFDLLNYTSAIHLGIYAHGHGLRDAMAGVEFDAARSLQIRLSGVYDFYQSNNFQYNMGVGIVLNRVAGFSSSVYDMRLDYNYTLYPYPRLDDPSHVVSVSFLGQSTDRRPTVLSPSESFQTDQNRVRFNGTSDRNALVYAYNGESLVGQTSADNNGRWKIDDLTIDSGYNAITFRSKTGINDLSRPSVPIVIHYDNMAPTFNTEINIFSHQVELRLTANEPLSRAMLISNDGTSQAFKHQFDTVYSVMVPLPDAFKSGQPLPSQMLSMDVVAIDAIGNRAPTQSVSFFVETLFPTDQSVVYNDALTVLGRASAYVEQILVNQERIVPDKSNGFSKSVQLDFGKQLIVLNVKTKNGQQLNYYARLLCMKRFSDIPTFAKYRRDIEFLATLGFVTAKEDGLFHPEDIMTRKEVTLAIAKQKNIQPKELTYDPFIDVSKSDPDAGIISAAVDAGITYAYADGTFKPNEPVSVADAFKMLNNSGVIESDEIVVKLDPIKRYEFALFFKQVRRYDQRVMYLMDWSQGYELPK
jgi:hypothetical protein